MEEKSFKKYIILWLSQSISGLGSSMTGFALILWTYEQSHSVMSISLMSFCNYVPYVFLSLFVGNFIDRHRKKTIMLVSDSIAAVGGLPLILHSSPFAKIAKGFDFLKKEKGIFYIMFTMALINFCFSSIVISVR